MAKCRDCGGTGRLFAMRSWFISDGYYSVNCGMCSGSGKGSASLGAEYVRFQRVARERVASDRRWLNSAECEAMHVENRWPCPRLAHEAALQAALRREQVHG